MLSFGIELILAMLAVLCTAMLFVIVILRKQATEDSEETGSPETHIKQDLPELMREVQGTVEIARQQSTCVICLDTVDVEQPVRKLRCSHAFHPQCILNWCLTQAALECPVCRDREPLGELGKAQGGEEQA